MHLYDVELPDSEVTLLTATMLAQAMYAQCDVDRNKYLLLECCIDIQKDPTAISLDDQKAVHNDQEYMSHTTLGWHICCQSSWFHIMGKADRHKRITSPTDCYVCCSNAYRSQTWFQLVGATYTEEV